MSQKLVKFWPPLDALDRLLAEAMYRVRQDFTTVWTLNALFTPVLLNNRLKLAEPLCQAVSASALPVFGIRRQAFLPPSIQGDDW